MQLEISQEPYEVNFAEWALLKLGNTAIRYAKTILPYAGNIASYIKETEGGAFQQWLKFRRRVPDSFSPRKTVKYILNESDSKAGSCGEYADLVYVFLRDQAPNTITINYYILKYDDHAFVSISDGRNRVIVDAWPPRAQALLFEHYKYSECYQDWISIYEKNGKKGAARKSEKQYSFLEARAVTQRESLGGNKRIQRSLERFLKQYPSVYGINGERIYNIETLACNEIGYSYQIRERSCCAMF